MKPTFYGLNPDLSNNGAEFLSWTLTKYLDKAGSFEGKAAGDIPFEKEGWLDVLNAGKIIFRGFIDEVTEDENPTTSGPGSQSVKAKDLWASPDEVFVQFQEYPALTTLNDMLSSDAPTAGKVIGLFWQLNSALPQGEASYTGANEIYKYAGYGTLSRCGTSAVYVDTTVLTLGSSATALVRGQYWRDANDLYIRCPDGRDPRYWICSITNYRESRLRRGTISLGTASFAVPYRIAAKGNFRSEIEKILLGKGLEIEFDHRAGTSSVLGLSYINAKANVGRGSLTAPVSEFKADRVVEFHEESTGTAVNAIIGSGPGSGYSQVTVAKSNMMSRGHWRERTYSSSVLGELLTASLAKIWTDTSDARCWVAQDEDDLSLMPGDFVGVTPPKSQNLVKRVKKIVHKSDETMTVEINQRILEPEDYMKAKAALLSDFNSFIGTQKTSWSASFGPTNIDDSTHVNSEFSGSAKFTVNIPAGTIDTEFATKFFLRMDIAAFEADLTSSETPPHDNGGSTGSHGGYGGNTGKKTQDAHQVLQTTGDATGWFVNVNYLATDLAGAHWHHYTASTEGEHGHVHGHTVTLNAVGAHSHIHGHSVTMNAVADHSHIHGHSVTMNAVAAHSHDHNHSGVTGDKVAANPFSHGHTYVGGGNPSTGGGTQGHAIASHWSLYGSWGSCATAGQVLIGVSVGGVSYDTVSLSTHTHSVTIPTMTVTMPLHNHGIGTSSQYAGAHTPTVSSFGNSGVLAGAHTPTVSSFGNSGILAGLHNHSGTVDTEPDHVHGTGMQIQVPAGGHVHTMPGHYTQTAPEQDHPFGTGPSNDRAIDMEPRTANLITQFKSMKDSGNSVHYLDVYVTLNGNPISGSPYPSLYIGDSIDDVDVSSLIISGNNKIEVSIKEHTSSSIPVRCAVRGSINAAYFMSPSLL